MLKQEGGRSDVSLTSTMTMRDYFAAKALPEVMRYYTESDPQMNPWTLEDVAADAYSYADAMLKERAR